MWEAYEEEKKSKLLSGNSSLTSDLWAEEEPQIFTTPHGDGEVRVCMGFIRSIGKDCKVFDFFILKGYKKTSHQRLLEGRNRSRSAQALSVF